MVHRDIECMANNVRYDASDAIHSGSNLQKQKETGLK